MVRTYRIWTTKEEEYLYEIVGKFDLETIATTLDRDIGSVEAKLKRMGLSTKDHEGELTLKELARLLKTTPYQLGKLKKNEGLPVKEKVTRKKCTYQMIAPKDFWNWAKKNQDKIDFTKYERYSILPEPTWVEDACKRQTQAKRAYERWSDEEDRKLMNLLRQGLVYEEAGELLRRTKGAIQMRVIELSNMNQNA
ncbi:hypothetical protein ACFSCX_06310 [Bacillus salitolerans]|uniref:DNA-binding protein n=1 Tax=Bacillus salitolerans TaxID=1437434 RepID=A0ABW4LLV9_9BACI